MAALARLSLPVLLAPPPLRRLQRTAPLLMAVRRVGARRQLGPIRCGGARAQRAEAEKEVAVPRSVPVRVAHELQQAGHRYLDVRTEDEFSGGHPVGAVNIPYMHRAGSGMTKNPHFLEQVSASFGMDDEIIIGCQSGKRSLMAATELCSAGFTAVTDIAGGFSAWMENGLPIEQL